MLKKLLGSVFGTRHERERKRVQPIVAEITEIGKRLTSLSDAELQGQTAKFRGILAARSSELAARIAELKEQKKLAPAAAEHERLDNELSGLDGAGGVEKEYRDTIAEALDDILPEAFATVREAARRLVGTTVSVTGQDLAWDMVHYDVQMIG
ncbi:MAG: preprotein translocase subunit SecA, partial [Gemmatimonadetes bacterium]|nr:preprotein translocase subunit SecA [Gemmatimonadota bacterium]